MKVLLIGTGHMGAPYAQAMSKSPLLKDSALYIYDRNTHKLLELEKKGNLKSHSSLADCLPHADIIFIAVKPHQIEDLFGEMRPHINTNQIFISIMAGVKLTTLSSGLGVSKVVRAMPNLPAKLREGMTIFTATETVSAAELKVIENLIDMTGRSFYVEEERLIDASTAISGSGPAYVFYFMQALLEAGEEMGFSQEESILLVSQTFQGTVKLFNRSNHSAESWIKRVAPQGGTTEAAIRMMNEREVNKHIKEAAFAAFKRAKELGQG